MTEEESKTLKNGIYVLCWKDGGASVAAVGRDSEGAVWFYPTDRAAGSCYGWRLVESVEWVMGQADAKPANHPLAPTSDQCSEGAKLPDFEGRPAYACWYPQMGGYVGKAVVVLWQSDRADCDLPPGVDDCFDAYIWHDGEFPIRGEDGGNPVRIYHCSPSQFAEFAEFVQGKQEKEFGEPLLVETTSVQTSADGVWSVQVKSSGELQIVDSKGRQRHFSKTHAMTGVHLAMMMARQPMTDHENLDAALRMTAERFAKEENDEHRRGLQGSL